MRTRPDLDYADLAKKLQGHIEDIVREGCGPNLITKFMVIAESVDEDGTRWLHRIPDPDMVPWEQHGLIAFALDNMGTGWQSIASGTGASVIIEETNINEDEADEDDEGEDLVDG